MQGTNDNKEARGGGPKGRKFTMGLKIALGQVDAGDGLISDDDKAQALFDLGFEMGYEGNIADMVSVLQGMLAGLEQLRDDSSANDNQQELDLVGD